MTPSRSTQKDDRTMTPRRGRRMLAVTAAGALLATAAPAAPAAAGAPVTGPSAAPAATSQASGSPLDRQALRQSLDAVHEAGMYGIYSAVRDGGHGWKGASGVADVETRRPVRADMRHRVGSITKTFTAVAVLQQVERGAVELDAPVNRYLPGLLPGERGDRVTVRMLLNHTSHIADYVLGAFPSLAQGSTASLDEHRFRTLQPRQLVEFGLAAPPTGEPGATPGSYSNTNYIIAGLLLEKVTGAPAERHITRHVIGRAGLRDTSFPRTPRIPGPHSKAYESMYGLIDPPRDYSVYDMSWGGTAGALVSTMDDLNRFYRALLQGRLLGRAQLTEMQKTVPVGVGGFAIDYGLGLYALDLPCGRFWGHDGGVWGMGTQSLASPDGRRLMSFGFNLMKYQRVNDEGVLEPHPIDAALGGHLMAGLCGPGAARTAQAPVTPLPADRLLSIKR
ncbi:D-alanyl-D-alanine carboxypeptidase [Nonomuraea muscovyensis]|uniref:D-alanyl-D-alanine carboxypeptidase n=1 Tax=Nonomuraea muscovyensis TaxID=1124761 RepID=A0A7X0C4L8_9ACTN|nr:serine hydrolase domain-containing protein [Nonomuraea muscovyensis]MBB6348307.1 D-alanyl-D-alanine carboxypeptidase [Nonomuraea muscovyensis]